MNQSRGLALLLLLSALLCACAPAGPQAASVPAEDRAGITARLAADIAFLASDKAGYITGQNIRIDGGITRSV